MTVPVVPARRAGARRRLTGVAAALALATNTACYTYAPLATVTPAAGQHLALELSDQGRVAVSERLGPGVVRVEGRLLELRDSVLHVGVTRVATVGGGVANWAGERVAIPQSAVARTTERRLSKTRSFLAAGIVVAAVVAFALTRDLLGFATPETEEKPPPIGEG